MVSRKTRHKGKSPEKINKMHKVSGGIKKLRNNTTPKRSTAKSAVLNGRKNDVVTKSVKSQASAQKRGNVTTIKKKKKSDAYIFDETDDFVSGPSVLSTSLSAFNAGSADSSNKKKRGKCSENSIFKKVASTKLEKNKAAKHVKEFVNVKNKNVSSQSKHNCKAMAVDMKKTSTPLAAVTPDAATTAAWSMSNGKPRRSPRILIPKLDLDMTVTPILPFVTPVFTSKSNPQKSAKSVSFSKLPDRESTVTGSQATPKGPAESLTSRKSARQSHSLKQDKPVVTRTRDLKSSKRPSSDDVISEVVAVSEGTPSSVAAKKPKLTKNETLITKSEVLKQQTKSKLITKSGSQNAKPTKQGSMRKQQSTLEQTPTELSGSKTYKRDRSADAKNGSVKHKRSAKVSKAQTDAYRVDAVKRASVWKPGKEKMYCTPGLYDCGISLGEDMSSSSKDNSAETPSLPGFMEDEPLLSELRDLTNSPVSSPVDEASADPDSVLNKSVSKEYKRRSAKREKGRYSTSRVDAWASAVNQSLKDVESFELVVE